MLLILVCLPKAGYSLEYSFSNSLKFSYRLTFGNISSVKSSINKLENEYKSSLLLEMSKLEKDRNAAANNKTDRDDMYIQLLISSVLSYITTKDDKHMKELAVYCEYFKDKLDDPFIGYYYHYAKALEAVANKNSIKFCDAIYKLYFDDIYKLSIGAKGENTIYELMATDSEYLSLNVYDLIINKAVIQAGLQDLDSLAPIIWLLKKDFSALYDKNHPFAMATATITNHFTGALADNFKLNYATYMYEGDRVKNADYNDDARPITFDTYLKARALYIQAYQYGNPTSAKGKINSLASILRTGVRLARNGNNDVNIRNYLFGDADRVVKELSSIIQEIKPGSLPNGYVNKIDLSISLTRAAEVIFEFMDEYYFFAFNSPNEKLTPEGHAQIEATKETVLSSVLNAMQALLNLRSHIELPQSFTYLTSYTALLLAESYYNMAKFDRNNEIIKSSYKYYIESSKLFPFEPYTIAKLARIENELGIEDYKRKSPLYHFSIFKYLASDTSCTNSTFGRLHPDYSKISSIEIPLPRYTPDRVSDCALKYDLQLP